MHRCRRGAPTVARIWRRFAAILRSAILVGVAGLRLAADP
jgi:hypothetical protein